MIRPAGALGAVILLAVASLGCAGPGPAGPATSGPQTTTIEVSYDDLLNQKQVARAVTLRVGDFLQVSLGSNASTGFGWAPDMEISDPGVLAQTGHEAVGPAQGSGPGAAGREVWVLQAVSAGTATVITRYGRPWEGGEKDSWTFTAEVTVR
ncbi:protease inhibitor I42 family protein [Mycolicibacterium sp.]|uniref:protease inhibitor I42 family protein n=1 Tax=Mycolicibacterium sp. TaxID=2320850 RepID=UPI0028AA0355|nr:protease inhibitor I42 family protein [Mycolicibacterium sp.]